jgi:hypothetical protein
MLKMLIFLAGLAIGAGATTAWLLAQPDSDTSPTSLSSATRGRAQALRSQLDAALAEGRRTGQETENRLRAEFETYRRATNR